MFASVEWQADTMGDSLLMPRRIIENALAKYNKSNPIRVYGDNTITSKDKACLLYTSLTLVAAKAATCTTAGNSAYYTCDGCDKWFADATGSVEITRCV